MGEAAVKLYGMSLSPYVLRVEWALRLKGIEYEYVNEDLSNKSPELLRYNPAHKRVPVLLHHGKPIAESIVILEYIDEVWKDQCPILPKDPYQKALVRFWARVAEEKVMHSSFDVFSAVGEEQQKAVEVLQGHLKSLEGFLEGKKFFGGETIGLVDIVASWIPIGLRIIEEIVGISFIDEERLPLISVWIRDILDLDLVKETMPPRDKALAHMRAIRANILSALPA